MIKAILTASPAGTFCTGIPVEFDGSGSKTPNPPIVSYRFTYIEFPILAGLSFLAVAQALEEYVPSLPVHVLASGHSSGTTATFTWNRLATEEDTSGVYLGQPWRDPVIVTLTVTDLAGATAKSIVTLLPGQSSAVEPRVKCPKLTGIRVLPSLLAGHLRIALSGAAVGTTMSCKSTVPCAGSVSVLAARGPLALRAKAKPGEEQAAPPGPPHVLHHRAKAQRHDPSPAHTSGTRAPQAGPLGEGDRAAHERHALRQQEHPLDPRDPHTQIGRLRSPPAPR